MLNIIRLTPSHAHVYRDLMLLAYASEPEAFTSTVPEREPLPMAWWKERVSDAPEPRQCVFGAFVEDRLVGVAGLKFNMRVRTRHRATLFGMFVLPEFTGRGIGRDLVGAVLAAARRRPPVVVVDLTVTESNRPALRLYESCGFLRFGVEPLANRLGERFIAKVHMWCRIDSQHD